MKYIKVVSKAQSYLYIHIMIKEFTFNGTKHTCTEQDILKQCGNKADKIVRCKKAKYGFEVIYQMKVGKYDSRDSDLVNSFISYFCLARK